MPRTHLGGHQKILMRLLVHAGAFNLGLPTPKLKVKPKTGGRNALTLLRSTSSAYRAWVTAHYGA